MQRWSRWLLIPLFALAPLLMAPSGGLPSRPQFASVGVGTAPPAGSGSLTASGAVTAATAQITGGGGFLVAPNTYNAYSGINLGPDATTGHGRIAINATNNGTSIYGTPGIMSYVNGTLKSYMVTEGVAGNSIPGSAAGDIAIVNQTSGRGIYYSSDGGTTGKYLATTVNGAFTGTWGGFSTPPVTTTIKYSQNGTLVTISIPASPSNSSGTSNSNAFTLSGIPAAVRPATEKAFVIGCEIVDNGVATGGANFAYVTAAGAFGFLKGVNVNGWTASGTKGLIGAINANNQDCTFTYDVN
jgi:hypothetical protein